MDKGDDNLFISEPVSYSNPSVSVVCRPSGVRPASVRRPSVNNLTINYVDKGFSITVEQNSMKPGTTIIWKVLMMHIVRFLKSDHSAPSGGRLKLSKNMAFALLTFIYVDTGFSKTAKENSMRLGTAII